MARLPRLAAAGLAHLLSQRGHDGRAIFVDRADREDYVRLLREAAAPHRVAVHAYALTDSEVLLLATPAEAAGLSAMMQALGRRYVTRFNRRHGHTGTLWDGRFRATVIEPGQHLAACICFVELAPVRCGLVREAQDHPWSSARNHLGQASDPLVADHPLYWAIGNTPFEREAAHRRLLEIGVDADREASIAATLAKGWVLGSESFAQMVEGITGRRTRPGRRGRPRKLDIAAAGINLSPNNT